MRDKLKKIIAYIFWSWKNEPEPPHPLIKIIPPFFLELLSYFIGLSILYQIVAYFWNTI